MEISRLKALRELSNRGTITAAADILHLTASAVSQQIAQLEEEVGLRLTERRGRGVKLTPAGIALVEHVDRLLNVLDEARSELATLGQEIGGSIRVAAFATAAAALLPAVIRNLKVKFPRLEITLVELEPAEGLASLNSWTADVALVDNLTIGQSRFERTIKQEILLDDGLYVIMANNHSLAGRKAIELLELRDEKWALDSASSVYGDFVVSLCRKEGFIPQVNAECRGMEIIAAMVASGCSISVIPGLRLSQMPADVIAIPVSPAVRRQISVAYRLGERLHPAVQAFVGELKQIVHSSSGSRTEI